jgi:multidrug efflux pump subunit AcrA (membrane-fusion protein)
VLVPVARSDRTPAVYAEIGGKVAEVRVRPGSQVDAGDLLLRFEG